MGIIDNFKASQTVEEQEGLITPLGGALVGGTPDEVKMRGTKAQKKSALSEVAEQERKLEALPEEQTLRGATRYATPAQTLSPELEEAKGISDRMKDFGSLGRRVENYVKENMLKGSDVAQVVEFTDEDVAEISSGDVTKTKGVLNEFNNLIKTDEAAAWDMLAKNKGAFKDASTVFAFLEKAYPEENSQKDALSRAIASNIIDVNDLTLGKVLGVVESPENLDENAPIESLGGMSVSDLVEFVGPEWYNMKVADIGGALEAKRDEILGSVADIQGQLRDPNLPPAVRQQLMEELGRYAATGVLQAEMETQRTIDAVNESGSVRFGGKTWKVDELLADDNIQSLVTEYMTADENTQKKLKEDPEMKEFFTWVDGELSKVMQDSATIKEGLREFEELQESNKEAITNNAEALGIDTSLDPDVMTALGFDPEKWTSADIDLSKNPVLKTIMQMQGAGELKNADIGSRLNDLDPAWVKELSTMNPADIKKSIQLLASNQYDQIKELSGSLKKGLKAANSDDVLKDVFGSSFGNTGQLKTLMSNLKLNAALGDANAKNQLASLEKYFGKGGVLLDDTNKLKGNISKILGKQGSLKDLLNTSGALTTLVSDRMKAAKPSEAPKNALVRDYAQMLSDGKLPTDVVIKLQKGGDESFYSNIEELYNELPAAQRGKLKPHYEKAMQSKGTALANKTNWKSIDNKMDHNSAFGIENELRSLAAKEKNPLVKAQLEKALKDAIERTNNNVGMGKWKKVWDTSSHFTQNVMMTPEELFKYFPGATWNDIKQFDNTRWSLKHVKADGGFNPKIQKLVTQRWLADRRREYNKKYK